MSVYPPTTLWLTGIPGAGKSTIAHKLADHLASTARVQVLDGDIIRRSFFKELGFSAADRTEQTLRTGELAAMFAQHGIVTVVSVIAPYCDARKAVRAMHDERGLRYLEVHIDAPPAVCAQRDPKGHYAMAAAGRLLNFTGTSGEYERPDHPELHLRTDLLSVDECVAQIAALL